MTFYCQYYFENSDFWLKIRVLNWQSKLKMLYKKIPPPLILMRFRESHIKTDMSVQ